MRIYQNLGIHTPKDANLPVGTIRVPYKIKSAKIVSEKYQGKEILEISAEEDVKKLGSIFSYGLIGKEVINPFIEEINNSQPTKGLVNKLFKKSPIENLVGKVIFAFISPSGAFIQGISPKY